MGPSTSLHPTVAWAEQIARNLTDSDTVFLASKRLVWPGVASPRFSGWLRVRLTGGRVKLVWGNHYEPSGHTRIG